MFWSNFRIKNCAEKLEHKQDSCVKKIINIQTVTIKKEVFI